MTRWLLALMPFNTSVLPTMTPFSSSAYWKGQKHYEGISKLVPCNEDASNVQESWMHMNLSPTPQLVFGSFAVRQKSAQPALDACNTAIGHQSHIFLVAFRLWTDQFNTPFQQPFAKRITVVLLIDYDADSIFSRLTTSIHFVSCPPLLFPTSGPLVWLRQNCQQQIVSTQSN